MDQNDKIDMLTGKKENTALSKMLGKKLDEKAVLKNDKDSILNKIMGKAHNYEDELKEVADTVKCPKCGHEFNCE